MPPSRGQRSGTGQNVLLHSLYRLNASMNKQKNHSLANMRAATANRVRTGGGAYVRLQFFSFRLGSQASHLQRSLHRTKPQADVGKLRVAPPKFPIRSPRTPPKAMAIDISTLHNDLASQPWVVSILTAPNTVPFNVTQTVRNHKFNAGREDSLTSATLNTADTFRAFLPVKTPTATNASETCTFFSLGDGMNGHEGILHGGIVSTCLDIGMAVPINASAFTAFLKIDFKQPLLTPNIVVCRARLTKREGRKFWIEGTLEDGHGTVYATGECLYVRAKPANL